MKFKILVEYEYPVEHKLPVKAELILHGDRVVTDNIKPLDQKPTTKNDLAVDCISREKALDVIRNLYPSMPRVDFNGSLRKWVDEYKPYIECEDAIEELPSVTPQEPRTGHWIFVGEENEEETRNGNFRYICSECGYSDVHAKSTEVPYCWHCGAKMVDPQESEDKE